MESAWPPQGCCKFLGATDSPGPPRLCSPNGELIQFLFYSYQFNPTPRFSYENKDFIYLLEFRWTAETHGSPIPLVPSQERFLVPSQEKIQEQTRHKSRVAQVERFIKVRICSQGVRVSELKREPCAQGLGLNLLLIVVN